MFKSCAKCLNNHLITRGVIFLAALGVLVSCSNPNNEHSNITVAGTWYSECVDASLKPFPMYYSYSDAYVIVELIFDNGEINASFTSYSDSSCSNNLNNQSVFAGTYTLDGELTTETRETVKQIEIVGGHPLSFFEGEFTTYYIVENGLLYMNDISASEVRINRDVAFVKC